MDPKGYHLFTCNSLTSRLTKRHDALLRQFIQLANCASVKTQDNHLTDFRELRPDDLRRTDLLFYGLGANSSRLYTDLAVGLPCSQTYVGHASKTSGYTLGKINERKRNKYGASCAELGADFCPLAFETFGKSSAEVHRILKSLTELASDNLHIPYSVLLSYWKRRLSTTLQIENSLFIMKSCANILSKTNLCDNSFGTSLNELDVESLHAP